MNCALHIDLPAVAVCCACGRGICATCRNKMFGRNYCDGCAANLEGELRRPQTVRAPVPARLLLATRPRRHPGTAALLSFLFPGAGQLYAGRVGRGIVIFFATFGTLAIGVGALLWIANIFDAAHVVREENRKIELVDIE